MSFKVVTFVVSFSQSPPVTDVSFNLFCLPFSIHKAILNVS